jgi:hypothetical protein
MELVVRADLARLKGMVYINYIITVHALKTAKLGLTEKHESRSGGLLSLE